jgi:hypothetical protein
MTRSSISIFLLVVALVWAAAVSWFFVMVGGASNPAYIAKALLWFSWLFVGPLLLVVGTIVMLTSTHQKVGSILSVVACFILTVMVGYQTLSMLHDAANPLIAKPPYAAYVMVMILTFLADAAAVRLYRLASLAVSK